MKSLPFGALIALALAACGSPTSPPPVAQPAPHPIVNSGAPLDPQNFNGQYFIVRSPINDPSQVFLAAAPGWIPQQQWGVFTGLQFMPVHAFPGFLGGQFSTFWNQWGGVWPQHVFWHGAGFRVPNYFQLSWQVPYNGFNYYFYSFQPNFVAPGFCGTPILRSRWTGWHHPRHYCW